MNHHPPKNSTPGASKKRKDREAHYPFNLPAQAAANTITDGFKAVSGEPVCPNRLLAGYMAYEFLSKGTLFGQKYDPVAVSGVEKPERQEHDAPPPSVQEKKVEVLEEHRSYGEVASILKAEGPHIPGIVNPTQLAKWIQM